MFLLKTNKELQIKPEIGLYISICKGEREVSNRSLVRPSPREGHVENAEEILTKEIPDHSALWTARKGGERLWFAPSVASPNRGEGDHISYVILPGDLTMSVE